jgi:diguanylate cyclase (GGDEF)-like protein
MDFGVLSTQDNLKLFDRLKNDLDIFVRESIELSSSAQKWSELHTEFTTVRCWEIKNCGKQECPAYESDDYRCWLISGTLCGEEVQGEFAKKYKACSLCDVFRASTKDLLRGVYENIDILIFHLHQKIKKLHEAAICDHLTGLYNRRFFSETIERELSSAQRRSELLSFIMIDLDNFKDINDTCGHVVGDDLLKVVATLIRQTMRKSDLAFRFGGDEFLVVLMSSVCDSADGMPARLAKAVERWNQDKGLKYGVDLSLSIGCSTCGEDGDFHAALKRADSKMYQNKKAKKED